MGWGRAGGVGGGEQGEDTSSVAAQTSLAPLAAVLQPRLLLAARLLEVAMAMLVQPWLPKVALVSGPLVPLNLCPAAPFFLFCFFLPVNLPAYLFIGKVAENGVSQGKSGVP